MIRQRQRWLYPVLVILLHVPMAAAAQAAGPRQGARILFDAAHHNWLGAATWDPLLAELREDGHLVSLNQRRFTPAGLAATDVLIVANPSPLPRDVRTSRGLEEYWWGRTAAAPALEDDEVDAIVEWVTGGGGLVLMIGHAPSGAATSNLTIALGADVRNSITRDPGLEDPAYAPAGSRGRYIRFRREDGSLREHPITTGRSPDEKVESVTTYVGTSVMGPPGSATLLALSDKAVDHRRDPPGEGGATRRISASGRGQAVAFGFGEGRVAIVTETGMFTEGTVRTPGGEVGRGLSYQGAQNARFLRNAVSWVARRLP